MYTESQMRMGARLILWSANHDCLAPFNKAPTADFLRYRAYVVCAKGRSLIKGRKRISLRVAMVPPIRVVLNLEPTKMGNEHAAASKQAAYLARD